MGEELSVAILVFLASAGTVMFCGAKLAVYGDALASLTGLGRLFVAVSYTHLTLPTKA